VIETHFNRFVTNRQLRLATTLVLEFEEEYEMTVRNLEDVIWERVGDRWLTGKSAAAALGVSALISMLLVAALIGVLLGRAVSVLPRLLLETIVFLGVGGTLVLMSAMRRYWAKLDNQDGTMRSIWHFFLRFLMFFGPALYYLCVYVPQLRRRWAAGARSAT
jgi:hypothetical protein